MGRRALRGCRPPTSARRACPPPPSPPPRGRGAALLGPREPRLQLRGLGLCALRFRGEVVALQLEHLVLVPEDLIPGLGGPLPLPGLPPPPPGPLPPPPAP